MPGKDKEIVECYHCGDECRDELIVFDDKNFCCHGCKTVYEILKENDLCTYYDLDKNPGISLKSRDFDDKYAFLDNDEIVKTLADYADEHRARFTFYIPAIHCSSCIWLLENLYQLKEGVTNSRVNFVKKELQVDINTDEISLRELVEQLATLGYEPSINLDNKNQTRQKAHNRQIYLKIGVAGFAFGNIMLLSFPEYFGFEGLTDVRIQQFIKWLNLALSLPVVLYCSSEYYVSAYKGLKHKFINIDVPITIGIFALFGRSLYEVLMGLGPGYFDSLAGLLFFLLIGKWFQNYTYEGLSFERDYKAYFPLAVNRQNGAGKESVLVSQLKVGDLIEVRNKEVIPADCTLQSNRANIDFSFVTGEADTVAKKSGDYVYAGGRQVGPAIRLKVEKTVSQSYLTQLWNNEAFLKHEHTEFESLVNRISKYFTFAILFIATASLIGWAGTDLSTGIMAFISVLIVACPCALSMATPFTLGNTMRIFGRNKFYVKNTGTIEKMVNIDEVVFDKTGTITVNQASEISFESKMWTDHFAVIAANMTRQSTHPTSRAIHKELGIDATIEFNRFEEVEGKGIIAEYDGKTYRLGSCSFALNGTGRSGEGTYFTENENEVAVFKIQNKYRDGLEEVLKELSPKQKISVVTGDTEREREVLTQIFLSKTQFLFRQTPEDKLRYIESIQAKDKKVLMIGDGLNDAGALKKADIGISVTDNIAHFTPASDVIMEASVFRYLPLFLKFSRWSRHIIIVSFVISFLYNIIGLGFAVSGQLTPLFAAILMPLSSITVVGFSTLAVNFVAKRNDLLKWK